MFLIVGLGNPGTQYAHTRHNAGWFVIDELTRRHSIELVKKNADYKVGLGLIGEQKIALVKPQTFMNLSGRAVQSLKNFYRVELDHILVLSDDLNLPIGRLRFRGSGSDGGHNGLKSVAQMLGSTDYARLRFGVGEPPSEERAQAGTAGFVLRPFSPDEWDIVKETTRRAADGVECFVQNGLTLAMNRFKRVMRLDFAMKKSLLLASLLLVPCVSQAKPAKKVAAKAKPASIVWRTDYDAAMKEAKRLHKPVFVDFYTDWCGWCKVLDEKTYTDPKFVRASRDWVMVKLNAEKGARNVQITQKNKVDGFPTMLMLDARGKVLNNVAGYMPPEQLLGEMQKAQKQMGAVSAQNPIARTVG